MMPISILTYIHTVYTRIIEQSPYVYKHKLQYDVITITYNKIDKSRFANKPISLWLTQRVSKIACLGNWTCELMQLWSSIRMRSFFNRTSALRSLDLQVKMLRKRICTKSIDKMNKELFCLISMSTFEFVEFLRTVWYP